MSPARRLRVRPDRSARTDGRVDAWTVAVDEGRAPAAHCCHMPATPLPCTRPGDSRIAARSAHGLPPSPGPCVPVMSSDERMDGGATGELHHRQGHDLALRGEKTAAPFRAFIAIACAMAWIALKKTPPRARSASRAPKLQDWSGRGSANLAFVGFVHASPSGGGHIIGALAGQKMLSPRMRPLPDAGGQLPWRSPRPRRRRAAPRPWRTGCRGRP